MITIKKYLNESDVETFEVECISSFYQSIESEIRSGWRLFEDVASEQTDITSNSDRLLLATDIVMLKPAAGVALASGLFTIITTALSVASTIYSLAIADSVDAGNNSRDQFSSTNALGNRSNQSAIGSRMPDIKGKVGKHTPPLAQLPHKRYENDTEVEHFAAFVSVGEGLIENVKDGETKFESLNQSKINFWKAGGNPNNGIAPYLTIGGEINRPLVNVVESGELQGGEMLPPNDLGYGEVTWFLTGNGNEGTVRVESDDADFDMNDYFTLGDTLIFNEVNYLYHDSTVTLTYDDVDDSAQEVDFNVGQYVSLSAPPYTVESITADSMIVSFTGSAGDDYYDAWQLTNDYEVPSDLYLMENTSGSYSEYTDDTRITEEDYRFTGGMVGQGVIVETLSFLPAVSSQLAGIIGPYQVPEAVTQISFNVVADSGYYKLRSNNEVRIEHNFTCIVDETDSEGNPTGSGTVYPFTFNSHASNITAGTGQTVDIDMNDYAYQRVSFRRISSRDKASNISNADKAILRDLYFYTELSSIPDWGDITIAQISVYSNAASQGVKERQISLDFTRSITRYSNGLFEPTAEIADVITDLALDPYNGRLTLDDIDADLYQEIQAQLVDYFGNDEMIQVGYCLDSTKMRFQEMYSMFWTVVACESYAQGATYRAYPDLLREDSSKQFTHRNKIIGTDSSESIYDIDNDSVEVTYRDNETGLYETVERFVNGVDGNNPIQIELSAAVNAKQAQVRADRELNILLYQTKTYSFESDGIALLTTPGERVDVVDDSRICKRESNDGTYEIYSGYVVNQSGLQIQLSEPVFFADNDLHTIRFTKSNGDLLESIACTAGTTKFHVILAQAPSEPIYLGYKQERTNFTFAADRLRQGMAILVRGLDAGNSNGIKTRKVTGINYSELYYQNDKD